MTNRSGYRCLLVALCALAGSAGAEERLNVAVTLTDVEPIVAAVAGDAAETFVVMPPGGDPHSYSAPAALVERVGAADLIVFADPHHLGFEERLLSSAADVPHLGWEDYAEQGARLGEFPGMPANFHGFWLDLGNAAAIAQSVAEVLIELGAPEPAVRANLKLFTDELAACREAANGIAEQCGAGADTLVIAVPGVAYVVSNAGLEVGAMLLSEGAGFVGGAQLATISNKLRSGSYAAVVCPESMREAKPGEISRQLANDTGCEVRYVRFLQQGDGSASYLAQAYHNLVAVSASDSLVEAPVSEDSTRAMVLVAVALVAGLLSGWVVGKRGRDT